MIRITKKNDQITFTGHTIPDICAAVSSVMYTTANALLKYKNDCINYTDDEDTVTITINYHDEIIDMLIDNMFDMFNDIKEDGNIDKIIFTKK